MRDQNIENAEIEKKSMKSIYKLYLCENGSTKFYVQSNTYS